MFGAYHRSMFCRYMLDLNSTSNGFCLDDGYFIRFHVVAVEQRGESICLRIFLLERQCWDQASVPSFVWAILSEGQISTWMTEDTLSEICPANVCAAVHLDWLESAFFRYCYDE